MGERTYQARALLVPEQRLINILEKPRSNDAQGNLTEEITHKISFFRAFACTAPEKIVTRYILPRTAVDPFYLLHFNKIIFFS